MDEGWSETIDNLVETLPLHPQWDRGVSQWYCQRGEEMAIYLVEERALDPSMTPARRHVHHAWLGIQQSVLDVSNLISFS